MELLLLSSSRTPAGYLTDYMPIPFAAVSLPWEEYTRHVQEALGFPLHGADELPDADLVIVGGGNTFQLLRECRRRGLLEPLRKIPRYLGWSAGANLACPTIGTTNDMPIADPGSLEALGLIPIQVNPHYLNVSLPGHHGETRNERLVEFVHARIELHGPHPALWFEHGKDPLSVRAGTWRWPVASNAATASVV